MKDIAKTRVLFFRRRFFKKSETFIYNQAVNPYIHPILLTGKFYKSPELPIHSFIKFRHMPTLIDWILSKLSNPILYYGKRSIAKIEKMLQGQSFDLIHAQFGVDGVSILPLAKLMNVPLVVSFHGFDASRILSDSAYLNGLKEVFDYASAIVVCNPGMADVLPLSEEHKTKVHWVPYGIDIHRFSTDNTIERQKINTFNILHVGRLIEKKGVPDLIRAFAQVAKEVEGITLHIVGVGREEKECRALVKNYRIEAKVIFHGWKSPSKVKELMQQSDIFVLNSRTADDGETEGLPVGLLEAMAMSRAIISTRHAGIPLAIENEVSGILVDEFDTDALSQQILRLYHSKELRQTLGKAARNKVENQFTMSRMHENLRDIYCRVIK